MSRRLLLAVSGGIVATDALLLDGAGTVLARARAGSTSVKRIGAPQVVAVVDALRAKVLAAAGEPPDAQVHRVVALLADIDLPAERRDLAAALSTQFPGAGVTVENDIHAVLWAGLRRPAGAAVYCAEGINAIARSATGRTFGYLALGTISGDWGGALSLGREVLYAASRAEDGRGPETSLRFHVLAAFRRRSVRDVVETLQGAEDLEERLAGLLPVLTAADAEGDPVARAILDRLAEEVVTMTRAAMERALVPPSGSDIILAGHVLTQGYERLDDRIDELFAERLPGAAVARLTLPPVAGAALAALGAEHGGPVGEVVSARLQESLHRLPEA